MRIFVRRSLALSGTKCIQAMLAEKFLLTCDLLERKTNGLTLSSILKSDGCHRSLAEILSLLATCLLKK